MRKGIIIWALCLTLIGLPAMAGNRIYSPRIQSLTSIVNGDWMNRPVLTLGSKDVLTIGFDELSHNYRRLTVHLEHCEADWTVSEGLFESDWIEGFNDLQIDDYQNSLYTHYKFELPNDRCRLRMSGNYRLTITDEDDERLADVEFYVVEPMVQIAMEVTTNTDIDHNTRHQQLEMKVQHDKLRLTNVEEELYTVVMQNWREDNARTNVKPNYMAPRELIWQHNRSLIFEAGNEYPKFEMLDTDHTTMGLERIAWDGEHYQAWPMTATTRRNYLTDMDADGAFCIRNSDRRESDYTCDYIMVNYTLEAPNDGPLYIDGHWTNHEPRDTYKMEYDDSGRCYRATIMQKQGYYSYQLLTENNGIPPSEGSFYQTENCYQALVYYRAAADRTWRLVGYQSVQFR